MVVRLTLRGGVVPRSDRTGMLLERSDHAGADNWPERTETPVLLGILDSLKIPILQARNALRRCRFQRPARGSRRPLTARVSCHMPAAGCWPTSRTRRRPSRVVRCVVRVAALGKTGSEPSPRPRDGLKQPRGSHSGPVSPTSEW